MKPLWLLLKNLTYVLVVPGILAGWLPLRIFERRPQWPTEWAAPQWAGLTLALAGAATFLLATAMLAVRGQGTPSFLDETRKLTRRGPYRWVRNPMYLGLLALVAGEGLFLRSWHIGVYFVVLACCLHLLVMVHEENGLRYRFGAVFEDYKRDVPRWLPRKPRPVLETVAPFESRR